MLHRYRTGKFVHPLVDGKQSAHAKEHECYDETPEINGFAETQRMVRRRCAVGFLHAPQQQTLIAAIGKGMDCFGQHRSRAGENGTGGFGDRDSEVCDQRIDDGFVRIGGRGHVSARKREGMTRQEPLLRFKYQAPNSGRLLALARLSSHLCSESRADAGVYHCPCQ